MPEIMQATKLPIRIVPLLHVKGNLLVKGVQLEGLRALGDPAAFAARYYEDSCDELVLVDIVASLYGRNNLGDVLDRTVAEVFVPVSAGGGIRSVEDARRLLLHGADKVLVNTSAVRRPQLIREIADVVGCQSMVVNIEAKRRSWGYEALTDNARECSGRNVVDWVQEAVALGAGEILLCSIDRDGTYQGFDLELIRAVSANLPVPLIAAGGCGAPEHVVEAVRAGADAVAISSLLHYGALSKVGSTSNQQEGNQEFLRGHRGAAKASATIQDIKDALAKAGYRVRLPTAQAVGAPGTPP